MELGIFKEKLLEEAFKTLPDLAVIKKLISNYFLYKPIPTVQANFNFVGRCRYNVNGEIFNNVSQLSYNPFKNTIKLQRCNLPKQQVFYAAAPTNSDNASLLSTAFVETCMEYIKDDTIDLHYMTFSRWQISRPLNVAILLHSRKSQERNTDFASAKLNFDTIIDSIVGENIDAGKYFSESLEFISDVFCQLENKNQYYLISSAYYNFILSAIKKKKQNIDGLIYPSANTEAAGMNIVLQKELIDNKVLYCDRVIMYAAKKDAANPKNFTGYDVSNEAIPDENGKFRFSYIR